MEIYMNKTVIPAGYSARLNLYDTQCAIDFIKREFSRNLSAALTLRRVSAPLFVRESSGLNDNLNGVERPVEFDIPAVGETAQIVHSLAKWKRMALARYGFPVGVGLYTDMNAVRRDEELDNLTRYMSISGTGRRSYPRRIALRLTFARPFGRS